MPTWQLAEAKNRLSEVINLALEEWSQRIATRWGAVVLVSEEGYQLVTGKKQSFTDYLCSGPSLEELDLQRNRSTMRDIKL